MLRDMLFPKTCVLCGFLGCYICFDCEKKLKPVTTNKCLYCESSSYFGLTHKECKEEYGIDGILSMFEYDHAVKTIIKNIKYKGAFDIFNDFLRVIRAEHIGKFYKYKRKYPQALLQAIPLYNKKLKMRGFNQSEIISRFFAAIFEYRQTNMLRREKETNIQAQIKGREARQKNLENAFVAQTEKSEIRCPVILVDDVVTTGSTVKEAAKVLKISGISPVFVFSLARG